MYRCAYYNYLKILYSAVFLLTLGALHKILKCIIYELLK